MTSGENSQTNIVVRLLFWAALLFALVMALIPSPPAIADISDKLQHAAAFATLAVLGRFAYPRWPILWLLFSLSLFGGLIEIAQGLPMIHRDSDPLDWVADTIACAVVLLAVGWWTRSKR